ncbi:MAG: nuclear transport factor 2 family protein [Candidatus Sericytochromatia bacterium]
MIPNLPKPIAIYFSNDRPDAAGLEHCFTEDAFVKDEGHTHTGIAAIKAWRADALKKYTLTSEPVSCEEQQGKVIVTSRESGNFPGSPLLFCYTFGLDGDKITSMEVKA